MARTYRATFRCHDLDDGSLIEPSLHYQTDVPTAGSEPDANDVAAGIAAILGGPFIALCHTKIFIDELRVRSEELKGSGVIPVEGTSIFSTPGTLTSTVPDLPRELVGIVNLHSTAATRSGRGYTTLPSPYVATNLVNRLWAGAYGSAGLQFANLLDNSFDLGTVQITHVNPVVYSHTRRQRLQEPFTFRVTRATFNVRPHWLRSRGTSP